MYLNVIKHMCFIQFLKKAFLFLQTLTPFLEASPFLIVLFGTSVSVNNFVNSLWILKILASFEETTNGKMFGTPVLRFEKNFDPLMVKNRKKEKKYMPIRVCRFLQMSKKVCFSLFRVVILSQLISIKRILLFFA